MTQSQALRFSARLAETPAEREAVLALRAQAFRGGAPDGDEFDPVCLQYLVEERGSGAIVCGYRLLVLPSGAEIRRSYSAQFYDLDLLSAYEGPVMEVGRFCTDPKWDSPDILRAAWAAITREVEARGVRLLFGCSSFPAADPARFGCALALLASRHVGPARWRPREKAETTVALSAFEQTDPKAGLRMMPSLLRSYLMMGGWVSDHAVIDPDLGTTHVFTGLEVANIPPARARALRALAGVDPFPVDRRAPAQ